MKTILCFIICLLPLMISANTPTGVVEGNNKFAFRFFHQVQRGTAGNNQFYSPFSISTALAMVYAGARNETAIQMSQTLNFQTSDTFHSEYKHLLDKLHDGATGKIKLNIANGLWAQKDFKFLDAYFDIVSSNYHSELKNMGMPLAFSPDGADFTDMTGKRDLFISKVIHQAFIDVDEKGTEAEAATIKKSWSFLINSI